MLVTFKTDVYANIIMFGEDALHLLKIMGHSGTVPSAILAEDVPAALSRLTAALEAEKSAGHDTAIDADADQPSVSLVKRGLPLIELLTAAAKSKSNVMWE